jgi:hypothetical protein
MRLRGFWGAIIGIAGLAAASVADPAERFRLAESQALTPTDTQVIVQLIDRWGLAMARCRKGDPGDQGTMDACGKVHALMVELDDLGWCYGHESDPGGPFFYRWHRCDIDSLHPSRP